MSKFIMEGFRQHKATVMDWTALNPSINTSEKPSRRFANVYHSERQFANLQDLKLPTEQSFLKLIFQIFFKLLFWISLILSDSFDVIRINVLKIWKLKKKNELSIKLWDFLTKSVIMYCYFLWYYSCLDTIFNYQLLWHCYSSFSNAKYKKSTVYKLLGRNLD